MDASQNGRRRLDDVGRLVNAMTDEREIADIYRQAEAEERDRERAEREERRLQAELDRPLPEPQWHHFRSVHEMSAREYSLWIDRGKPALMPKYTPAPSPPPAPPKPKELKQEVVLNGLSDMIGRLIARERERLVGELALRDARIEVLEARLRTIEQGLIARALVSEPLDLPRLPRLNGRDAH